MVSQPSGRDKRRFKRWSVSIPCTVEWSGREIPGRIDNLSYGGARIADLNIIPPQGILVTIQFRAGKKESKTTVTSKVVYVNQSLFEVQALHSLGVEFKEPPRKITTQLTRLFLKLRQDSPEATQSA